MAIINRIVFNQLGFVLSEDHLLIRNCNSRDLHQIQLIENSSFPEDPYPQVIFWSIYLSTKRIFRVAIFERKVIGYSIVKLEFLDRGEAISHLVSLAVDPATRKKGVGSKMLQDSIFQTKDKFPNCNAMLLEVGVDNKSAINLYSKFGFRKSGTISNYYGREKDALSMVLDYEATTET